MTMPSIGSVAYEALVEATGSPVMGDVLLQIADAHVGVDEVFGYCCGEEGAPVPIASSGRIGSAQSRVSLYARQYHAFDPLMRDAQVEKNSAPTRAYRITAQDIPNQQYRRECFDTARLAEKFSFTRWRAGRRFILSFYRAPGRQPVSPQMLAPLAEMALPILRKHLELSSDEANLPLMERLLRRMERIYPEMTVREREVCARTLIGMTAEAIGLDLEIKPSTVLTYRRRAYERFGICNANQLMARLLA